MRRSVLAYLSNGGVGNAPVALVMDAVFQRYGWDWWVYMSQPEEVVQECLEVMSAEAQHLAAQRARRERDRQRGGGGFSAPPRPTVLPAATHDELMARAKAEGFLDPPEE